jgi:hypothetical protein
MDWRNMTLDDAIVTLYAREINCGCETFWDGGIKVWIGDTMNGHHAETMFRRENIGKLDAGDVDIHLLLRLLVLRKVSECHRRRHLK